MYVNVGGRVRITHSHDKIDGFVIVSDVYHNHLQHTKQAYKLSPCTRENYLFTVDNDMHNQ